MLPYALITVMVSVAAALATWKVRSFVLRAIIVAAAAYGTAYSAYWSEVWLGAKDDQFATWAPLVINGCFGAGVVAGGVALLISTLLRRKIVARRS